MPIRSRLLAAFLGAAVLGACESPSSSSGLTPTVSFSYSGQVSGSFSVTAPRPVGAAGRQQAFVEGVTLGGGSLFVVSSSPVGNARADWVSVMGTAIAGEYDLAAGCMLTLCPLISGGMSQPLADAPQEGELAWHLEQGKLTILAPKAEGRVRGTFSGSGSISRFTGGIWQPIGRITISGGKFETDVVLRQPSI